jgi:putative CocE/NonD family hydrolase
MVALLLLAMAALPLPAMATTAVTAATAVRKTGYLTVADGTRLKWTVLLPKATGRFPTLLQYEGYLAGSYPHRVAEPFADQMLQDGYAILGVSLRGTACSGGVWDPFKPIYGQDGAQAVDWAAKQPWSSGKVGMFSFSFAGIMQLFVAENRPRALAAIAPGMVISDTYRDIGFPGGMLNDGFPPLWDVALHESWASAAAQARTDNDQECLVNIAAHQTANEPYSLLVQGPQHQFLDAWHRERSSVSALGKIDVPVLGVSVDQDEQVGPRGALSFTKTDPRRTWTVESNGYHGLYEDSPSLHALLHRYFDHYLKNEDNGWTSTPHVQLWQDTSEATKNPGLVYASNTRPFPVAATSFALQPDGRLGGAPNSGSLSWAFPTASPEYPDLRLATSSQSAFTWTAGKVTPGGYAAFTTPAFRRDTALAGPASVDAWISSTSPDADVQATITEVRPDGQELFVERGWLRLSHRALDASSTPLNPVHVDTQAAQQLMPIGQPQLARLAIQPFSHVFRTRSRLRVWLDTPSVTGLWNFLLSPTPSVLTLHTGHTYPSRLVVGVIPDATAQGHSLPACGSLAEMACRPDPLARASEGSPGGSGGPESSPRHDSSSGHSGLAATGGTGGVLPLIALTMLVLAAVLRNANRLQLSRGPGSRRRLPRGGG